MADATPDTTTHPRNLAVVLNGVVKQTINVDDNFAATLLAQPTFVEFTTEAITSGDLYSDGKFTTVSH